MEVKKIKGNIQQGPDRKEFFVSDELPILMVHKRDGKKVNSVASISYQKPWREEPNVDMSKYILEQEAELNVYYSSTGIYLPFLRNQKLEHSNGDHIDESNYYIIEENNRSHLVEIVKVDDYKDAEYGIIVPETSEVEVQCLFDWKEDITYKGNRRGLQVFKI